MSDSISRREFLKVSTTASGVLFFLPNPLAFAVDGSDSNSSVGEGFFGALEITHDNNLIAWVPRAEMGQNVSALVVGVLAEELETDPGLFQVTTGGIGKGPWIKQFQPSSTGGSNSTASLWEPLRLAAARIRALLLLSAQNTLGWDVIECQFQDGWLKNRIINQSVPFGDLVKTIDASIELTATPKPLDKARWIGYYSEDSARVSKSTHEAKVFAEYDFVADVPMECDVAVILLNPDLSGASNVLDKAFSLPGVKVIPFSKGVGLVASNTWAAMKAKQQLENSLATVESDLASEELAGQLRNTLSQAELIKTVSSQGQPENLQQRAPDLSAALSFPLLSHCASEPHCCVVDIQERHCRIWVATQKPKTLLRQLSIITGLPSSAIEIHIMPAGGSFGRQLAQDYIVHAVEIGKALGKPVRVQWDRSDMFRAGYFRPPAEVDIALWLDKESSTVSGMHYQIASPGKLWFELPSGVAAGAANQVKHWVKEAISYVTEPAPISSLLKPSSSIGDSALGGMTSLPYRFAHSQLDHAPVELLFPVGFYRSVGNTINIFAVETLLDEAAEALAVDPIRVRQQLIFDHPRLVHLLENLKSLLKDESAAWGLASFHGYGTYVATAALVDWADEEQKSIKIKRIVTWVDCGQVFNLDNVRAQIEGCICMGLSSALFEEITLNEGQVEQSNYNDYKIAAMADMPDISINIVTSEKRPGGIGEPVMPTIAPAIANSYRALTGTAIRRLPMGQSINVV